MTHPPFTIVVGCGRSGTTLVRAILDSHPELAVTHEAQVLTALARKRSSYRTGADFDVEGFVSDLYRNAQFQQVQIPEHLVRSALADAPPADFSEAMRRVFATHARLQGKRRYGDKTPGYVVRMPLLASLFPEARFVHVIRDGRDSALSYADRAYGPRNVAEAALRWRHRVEKGRRAGQHLGPDRYRELRYEDIVADAEGAIRPVCQFLGLAYDPAMLRYHERAADLLAATRNPSNFEHLAAPPTAGLRDWRTQMGQADVALFNAIAGATLESLGYDRGAPPPGPALRAHAAARWIAWQRRRVSAVVRRGSPGRDAS